MKGLCFFASDLHGKTSRWEKLFYRMEQDGPLAVFLGGDLLPSSVLYGADNPSGPPAFFRDFLAPALEGLQKKMGPAYPRVLLIPGNDDPCKAEPLLRLYEQAGLWQYIHGRKVFLDAYPVYGYACVPPTPFLLKDWERYDVSRYVDPGCVPPTEGFRTCAPQVDPAHTTIQQELDELTAGQDVSASVFLFHSPPHQTGLDRAALDGVVVDHVPIDVHVGSIAIRRFIEKHQPLLTLHGHIHESSRITGVWKERMGKTWALSAAHEGAGLALVQFSLDDPGGAERRVF